MAPPILALREASIRFGAKPLFEDVELSLHPGDRACLVGRNGCGKSTLLKALVGLVELDKGDLFVQPGTKIAYLPQNPPVPKGTRVADYIAGGLREEDRESGEYRVRAMLSLLDIEGQAEFAHLSGGGQRRAALARTIACEPDVMLLDEPTNHLDIPTIGWLENELGSKTAAILLVSHDRAFLRALSARTYWLDRGKMRVNEHGYAHFDEWASQIRSTEDSQRRKLEKQIARETQWKERGVTARRKRNQGRLGKLENLRRERAKIIRQQTRPNVELETGDILSRRVILARNLTKAFDGNTVIDKFSTRIMRGDRIGLVGPNGAGKTTLIRLLTGELAPDSGTVKLIKGLEPTYFDQNREQLDPKISLWETLTGSEHGGGGDSIEVRGRMRHVVAYLKDFLFDDDQARSPVSSLSGGERNRLLLAKLFARPSNLLVLDEPTNDLDMDMLDLLEDIISDYDGTMLLVSHDRDFLDRMVTSVIAFDPDGKVREYAGGYSDMLAQRGQAAQNQRQAGTTGSELERPRKKRRTKLSYKDQRALEQLPGQIESAEKQIATLEAELGNPASYDNGPDWLRERAGRLEAAKAELTAMQEKWLKLEMKREAIESSAP